MPTFTFIFAQRLLLFDAGYARHTRRADYKNGGVTRARVFDVVIADVTYDALFLVFAVACLLMPPLLIAAAATPCRYAMMPFAMRAMLLWLMILAMLPMLRHASRHALRHACFSLAVVFIA